MNPTYLTGIIRVSLDIDFFKDLYFVFVQGLEKDTSCLEILDLFTWFIWVEVDAFHLKFILFKNSGSQWVGQNDSEPMQVVRFFVFDPQLVDGMDLRQLGRFRPTTSTVEMNGSSEERREKVSALQCSIDCKEGRDSGTVLGSFYCWNTSDYIPARCSRLIAKPANIFPVSEDSHGVLTTVLVAQFSQFTLIVTTERADQNVGQVFSSDLRFWYGDQCWFLVDKQVEFFKNKISRGKNENQFQKSKVLDYQI